MTNFTPRSLRSWPVKFLVLRSAARGSQDPALRRQAADVIAASGSILNAPLTVSPQQSCPEAVHRCTAGRAKDRRSKGMRHGFRDTLCKNAGNPRRDQGPCRLRARAASAVPQRAIRHRHHARTSKGGNWTISLRSVAPDALWEASDIVADIQEAYDLSVAA